MAEEEWVCFYCRMVKYDEGSRAFAVVAMCIFHGSEPVSSGVEETVMAFLHRFSDGVGAVGPLVVCARCCRDRRVGRNLVPSMLYRGG